jgi:hypothetical protein
MEDSFEKDVTLSQDDDTDCIEYKDLTIEDLKQFQSLFEQTKSYYTTLLLPSSNETIKQAVDIAILENQKELDAISKELSSRTASSSTQQEGQQEQLSSIPSYTECTLREVAEPSPSPQEST